MCTVGCLKLETENPSTSRGCPAVCITKINRDDSTTDNTNI